MHTLYTIHGNGLSPDIFSELAVQDITIKHLTIPGHNGRPLLKDNSFPRLVEILKSEIDQTHNYSLMGFSLGGHLVHHLAADLNPEKIITLAAPPLSPQTIPQVFVPSPALSYLFTKDLTPAQKKELATKFLINHPEKCPDVIELLNRCDPQFRETLGLDVQNGSFQNEPEILIRHGSRCHFIFAKHDTLLNRDYINSLNLNNITWVESGHLIPWDNPDSLNQIMRSIFIA